MQVIEIKDKNLWNQFVTQNGSQFLQSWEWGEFQRSLGRKTWIIGVEIDENEMVGTRRHTNWNTKEHELICGALVVKHNLPLGRSYLYLPRGPVIEKLKIKNQKLKILGLFLEKIKEIAKAEKSIFIRMEPTIQGISIFNLKSEILNQTRSVQPKDEWRLDLMPSKENLLKAMHPKTRYNIGLAKRYGVKVREGGEGDFEIFWQLIAKTYKKKRLKTHPKNYYFQMLKLEPVKLYLAEYQGKILVANIMVFWGKEVIYLHGGSSDEDKKVMAPYAIFWETICEAKRLGYRYYNFGAVAPEESGENHPWFGITRFKKGFGGEEVNYAGTWDLPISMVWYKIYKFTKFITNLR